LKFVFKRLHADYSEPAAIAFHSGEKQMAQLSVMIAFIALPLTVYG